MDKVTSRSWRVRCVVLALYRGERGMMDSKWGCIVCMQNWMEVVVENEFVLQRLVYSENAADRLDCKTFVDDI